MTPEQRKAKIAEAEALLNEVAADEAKVSTSNAPQRVTIQKPLVPAKPAASVSTTSAKSAAPSTPVQATAAAQSASTVPVVAQVPASVAKAAAPATAVEVWAKANALKLSVAQEQATRKTSVLSTMKSVWSYMTTRSAKK